MKPEEIFKMRAEADTHHLQSKLEEARVEAMEGIDKCEKRINQLKKEIDGSKQKAEILKIKHQKLQSADKTTFPKAKKEFIDAIESLEDKNIFVTKTTEWFNNIESVASDLKKEMKEKVAQW